MVSSPISFRSACIKTLSAVEAHPTKSNQHEFNGVRQLKDLFGDVGFSRQALFSIRGTPTICASGVTWYDAREAHISRSEHRLYFQSNSVMSQAAEGDNILFGFDRADNFHCVLIKNGSASHGGPIKEWKAE